MKRYLWFCIVLSVVASTAWAARERQMSVQVREAQLRSAPGFLSRILVTVPYTERVSILEERSDWSRVRTIQGGVEGWLHNSALTSKRLTLSGDGPDAQLAVSSDEQALAGKGFNSDVEKEFKARNRNADFHIVDRMEKSEVPTDVILQFLKEGGLDAAKGGAQ